MREDPAESRVKCGTDHFPTTCNRVSKSPKPGSWALAALCPAYFDLTANPPSVILPAEFTKNRKSAVQPLAAELAAELQTYLKGRRGKELLWSGTWAERSANMLKLDLNAAGVPVDIEGPEGVEVRDFHALRNCYISDVLCTGADLKQAMTLARHTDPRLTAGRYARTRLHDLGAVVNKLPAPTPTTEPTSLRMTGTDGKSAATGAAPGAADSDYGRLRLMTSEENHLLESDGQK